MKSFKLFSLEKSLNDFILKVFKMFKICWGKIITDTVIKREFLFARAFYTFLMYEVILLLD